MFNRVYALLYYFDCISEYACSTIAWRLDEANYRDNQLMTIQMNLQLELLAFCYIDYCLEGYGQQTAVNCSCNETALEEWFDTNITCVTTCK